ncbi:reverse transcriptase [Cucumis melo var. makuwa]|uniref:Reverse transcriptase n=1 Tax=Cucumis melo var. makuwa TaxID=1194695 RepID=A0A5D3CS79_CUCMM|nr:reverse transcriptase [Cucumis melo var. makuwa]
MPLNSIHYQNKKWTFAEKLPRTIPVIQYSRIEEVDRIYDFLVGLNLKFNVVHGRILGQGPTPSLMEVCSKVQLKEDRTSAMNILTTFAIDCATSSVSIKSHFPHNHINQPNLSPLSTVTFGGRPRLLSLLRNGGLGHSLMTIPVLPGSFSSPTNLSAFTTSLDSTMIPKDIHIALKCPEWKTAVMEEMKALEKNNTLELCALPKGHKTMGCKWVFTPKYKADGTLDRHKARLALYQHVKNTFLNKDLEEESQGYSQGHSDHTLFTKVTKAGKIVVLIVYVDDIVLSGNDIVEILQLEKKMGDEFEIKNLGNLKYFLKIEFMQTPYEEHMEAVIRILRYLETTFGNGLMFRRTDTRCTIPILTGQGLLLIENPPLGIVLLCEEISLLGGVRNKELWP